MKTIVFVCLLSLSVCLSQPTTKPEAAAQAAAPAPTQQTATDPKTQKTDEKQNTTSSEVIILTTPATPSEAPHVTKNTSAPAKETAKVIDNKTDNKEPEKKEEQPEKPTEKAPPAAKNETKPADNKAVVPAKNETTTVHPAVVSSTTAPKDATEKPVVLARGFDGASFVGGIILTLGLLAIGFMGFKYYKNQTERNYHTL